MSIEKPLIAFFIRNESYSTAEENKLVNVVFKGGDIKEEMSFGREDGNEEV